WRSAITIERSFFEWTVYILLSYGFLGFSHVVIVTSTLMSYSMIPVFEKINRIKNLVKRLTTLITTLLTITFVKFITTIPVLIYVILIQVSIPAISLSYATSG